MYFQLTLIHEQVIIIRLISKYSRQLTFHLNIPVSIITVYNFIAGTGLQSGSVNIRNLRFINTYIDFRSLSEQIYYNIYKTSQQWTVKCMHCHSKTIGHKIKIKKREYKTMQPISKQALSISTPLSQCTVCWSDNLQPGWVRVRGPHFLLLGQYQCTNQSPKITHIDKPELPYFREE